MGAILELQSKSCTKFSNGGRVRSMHTLFMIALFAPTCTYSDELAPSRFPYVYDTHAFGIPTVVLLKL